MKRRKFIKNGILAISSIYWLPETLLGFNGKRYADSENSGSEDNGIVGLAFGKIVDYTALVPEEFIPFLTRKRVKLVTRKGKGFLMLIPEKHFPEDTAEGDKVELEFIKAETPLIHVGVTELGRDGNIYIGEKILKFAGIREGKVIFLGLDKFIEILDEKSHQ